MTAKAALSLRPYQVDAQDAIASAVRRGVRKQLISMATGLGKTVLIASLPEHLEIERPDVILAVAHRDELIDQLAEKFAIANPKLRVAREKAKDVAAADTDIVVASVQTLQKTRLARVIKRFAGRIALLIIDEAHHAAANSYRAIVDAILEAREDTIVLGFTATPNRADKVGLTEVFDEITFDMGIGPGTQEGYLVPFQSYTIRTQTNLDGIRRGADGDFAIGELAQRINTDYRNTLAVNGYLQYTPGARALAFAATVAHAKALCETFVAAGVNARWASGTTPKEERRKIVDDFRKGRFEVLVNCGLFLEGFDVPDTSVIVNARPTQSTPLYQQIMGRALRPIDDLAKPLSAEAEAAERRLMILESPKPHAVVLDVVDQARNHEVVSVPSLLGLPPQFDPQGRRMDEVVPMYERLQKLSRREADRVQNFEQLEVALKHAEEAEALDDDRTGTWRPKGEKLVLHRPIVYSAKDMNGRPIPDFSERYSDFVEKGRQIAPNAVFPRDAAPALRFNLKTFRKLEPSIELMPDGDGRSIGFISLGTEVQRVVIPAGLVHATILAEERLERAIAHATGVQQRRKTG